MEIDKSDAYKILDSLALNKDYHQARDQKNRAIHQAREVRNSPITTTTENAYERLKKIIEEAE